jgi:Leucine-rich repeat (LRR) protein
MAKQPPVYVPYDQLWPLPTTSNLYHRRAERAGIAWLRLHGNDVRRVNRSHLESFPNLLALELRSGERDDWADLLGGLEVLPRLQRLRLFHCRLRALPATIARVPWLLELELEDNPLDSLCPEIGALKWLERLSLVRTSLTALPDEVGRLPRLRRMTLDFCRQLCRLPASLAGLRRLEEFRAPCAQNLDLADTVAKLAGLSRLTDVHLGGAGGQPLALPESLGDLPSLRSLALNQTGLVALPEGLGRLSKLEVLWLSSNDLRRLPDGVVKLRRLSRLYLDHNRRLDLEHTLDRLAHLPGLELVCLPSRAARWRTRMEALGFATHPGVPTLFHRPQA